MITAGSEPPCTTNCFGSWKVFHIVAWCHFYDEAVNNSSCSTSIIWHLESSDLPCCPLSLSTTVAFAIGSSQAVQRPRMHKSTPARTSCQPHTYRFQRRVALRTSQPAYLRTSPRIPVGLRLFPQNDGVIVSFRIAGIDGHLPACSGPTARRLEVRQARLQCITDRSTGLDWRG